MGNCATEGSDQQKSSNPNVCCVPVLVADEHGRYSKLTYGKLSWHLPPLFGLMEELKLYDAVTADHEEGVYIGDGGHSGLANGTV